MVLFSCFFWFFFVFFSQGESCPRLLAKLRAAEGNLEGALEARFDPNQLGFGGAPNIDPQNNRIPLS